MGLLERIFGLKRAGTTPGREILAGVTTFMTMAYILVVDPVIMEEAGMPLSGVFLATALAAALGCAIMAFATNLPVAVAPAMGVNIYIALTLVIKQGFSYETALMAVALGGLIYMAACILGGRKLLADAIPESLQQAIGIGIGLFIVYLGLCKIGLFQEKGAFLPSLGPLFQTSFYNGILSLALGFFSTLLIALMAFKKWPGGILGGMTISWLAGILLEQAGICKTGADFPSRLPNFAAFHVSNVFTEYRQLLCCLISKDSWSIANQVQGPAVFLARDFLGAVIALFFVDFYGNLGTVFALNGIKLPAGEGKLVKKPGRLLFAGALSTFCGAFLGSTTCTAYLESSTGIIHGGRTGMAALVTALLFLIGIFACPLVMAIPPYAIGAALIVAGLSMLGGFRSLLSNSWRETWPALLAVAAIPLLRSIHDGIFLSVILAALLSMVPGRQRPFPKGLCLMAVLFLLYYCLRLL